MLLINNNYECGYKAHIEVDRSLQTYMMMHLHQQNLAPSFHNSQSMPWIGGPSPSFVFDESIDCVFGNPSKHALEISAVFDLDA